MTEQNLPEGATPDPDDPALHPDLDQDTGEDDDAELE